MQTKVQKKTQSEQEEDANEEGGEELNENVKETEVESEMQSKGESEVQSKSEITERMIRMEKKLDTLMSKYDKQCEKLEEVIKTLEFVSEEQKDLKKTNVEMKKQMQQMENRLQILENKEEKNTLLEQKMNIMHRESKEKEQYERNRNLEVNSLDWLPEENLCQVIQDLAKNFNIIHQDSEIEKAHRIPNRNKEKSSTVIIQFKHRNSRDKWLNEKKRIVTNDNMYRNGNRRRIYLNENMTPYTKTLFWKTKNFAKLNNFDYVWFRNGKIMMRKNKDVREAIMIREEDDLLNLQSVQNS